MQYPREVFSVNEDVTRKNMRDYENRLDKYYAEKAEQERKLGRKLNLKERYELRKEFDA